MEFIPLAEFESLEKLRSETSRIVWGLYAATIKDKAALDHLESTLAPLPLGPTAPLQSSVCPKIARFELCPGFTFILGLM